MSESDMMMWHLIISHNDLIDLCEYLKEHNKELYQMVITCKQTWENQR